jgi:polyhydroxyalkanoate synthesis regulator phasin
MILSDKIQRRHSSMKIKSWLAAAVAAALLGGVLLVGVPAVKASAVGNQSNGQAGQGKRGGYSLHMGRNMGDMGSNVAEFLGISQEDLSAARQAGQSLVQIAAEKGISEQQLLDYMFAQYGAQIDQLVTNGKITQEQADQHKQFMTERIKENINRTDIGPNRADGRGLKAGGKGAGMGEGLGQGGMGSNVAEFLGISQEDLRAARQAGQSLVQVAAEKGISEQQLLDYMLAQRGAQLDQLVTDGKITQEQADQHKQLMTERIKENINRTNIGPNRAEGRGLKAGGMGAGMGKGLGRGQGNCGGQCNGTGNGPCATAN